MESSYLSFNGQKLQNLCKSNQFTSISDAKTIFIKDTRDEYDAEVKRIQEYNLANGRDLNRSVNKAGLFYSDSIEDIHKFFNIIPYTQLKDIIKKAEIPLFFETNDGSKISHETMLNNIHININEIKEIHQFEIKYSFLKSYFDWIFLQSLIYDEEDLLK
jgi:hypothetical protein